MNAQAPIKPGDKVVTIHEAKTHLSRLLAEVEAGAEITVARGKTAVAKLVPLRSEQPKKRQLGWLRNDSRGSDPLAYGFWDPIPEIELALWEGSVDYPDTDEAAS